VNKKGFIAFVLVLFVITAVFIAYLNSNTGSFDKLSLKNFLDFLTDEKLSLIEDDIKKEYDKNEHAGFIIFDNFLYKTGLNGTEIISRKGEIVKVLDTSQYEPCLAVNNSKVFIGDRRGTEIIVVENKEIIKRIELPGFLYNMVFNEQGYGIITGMDRKEVSFAYIIDNKGDIMYKHFQTKFYAINGSLSNDNSELILNRLDTTGTSIKTELKFFNKDGMETGAITVDKDFIYPKLSHLGKNSFYIAGIEEIVFYKNREVLWEKEFKDIINIITFQDKEICLGYKENNSTYRVVILDMKGNIKYSTDFNKKIENILSYSGLLCINLGNEAVILNNKLEEKDRINSSFGIKKILFFNKLEVALISDNHYILKRINR
jgi:hypothetical protein